MGSKKRPDTGSRPGQGKAVPAGKAPALDDEVRPVWRFGNWDPEFPQGKGWASIAPDELDEVVGALRYNEQLTMTRLFQNNGKAKGHAVRYTDATLQRDLSPDARNRLADIRLELDHLIRIRVGGAARVYAFRDFRSDEPNVLNLLWWDRDHEIYPVEKH